MEEKNDNGDNDTDVGEVEKEIKRQSPQPRRELEEREGNRVEGDEERKEEGKGINKSPLRGNISGNSTKDVVVDICFYRSIKI